MADPPLISLRGARLSFGGAPLFADLELQIGRRDRACLGGRNGSGKSTLLKLIAGELEADDGERFVQPGIRIAHLHQDPVFDAGESVAAFVAAGRHPRHEVDAMLAVVNLPGDRTMGSLSELSRAWSAVQTGAIRPVVHDTLPMSRIADAHRLLEERLARGKVTLAQDLA